MPSDIGSKSCLRMMMYIWLCKYVCIDISVSVYPMCPTPKKHYRTNCADPSWKLILLPKVLIGSKIIHHWHLQLSQLTPGHPWQWRHFCAQRRVKYTRPTWTWRWMAIDWRKKSVSAPVKLKLFVSVGWVVFCWWLHTRKLTWQWKLIIFLIGDTSFKWVGFSIVMLVWILDVGVAKVYGDSRQKM